MKAKMLQTTSISFPRHQEAAETIMTGQGACSAAWCLRGALAGLDDCENSAKSQFSEPRAKPRMPPIFANDPNATVIPITFATKSTWDVIRAALPAPAAQFATANGYAAKPGAYLALPTADGAIAQVLFGLEDDGTKSRDLFRPGALPGLLPAGTYRFANAPHDTRLAVLAFALGTYRFGLYRKSEMSDVRLVPPDGVDAADITRMADAAMMARDLINTPSNDMGPAELQFAAQQLANRHDARFNCITGDDLLTQNFP